MSIHSTKLSAAVSKYFLPLIFIYKPSSKLKRKIILFQTNSFCREFEKRYTEFSVWPIMAKGRFTSTSSVSIIYKL